MSLLTIISSACARLSIAAPTIVVGNTAAQIVQMLYLAQEEGKNSARRCAWKALQAEKTFATTAAAVQTGAVPTDFDWMIPETIFNRTQRRAVDGPVAPQDWQLLQASLVGRVFLAYRILGSDMLITPTPTAGQTIAYEYVSKNWCASSGGTGQAAWAADTDTAKLDEEIFTQGVVWRFLKMRGMDHTDYYADYEKNILQAMMREGSRPRLSTDDPRKRFDIKNIIQGGYRVTGL
jgi:hypothetical protein